MKNAILSIALVGMLAVPALAAQPNSAYVGVAEIDNFDMWDTGNSTRTEVDPAVYLENTLGTSYIPGAAGTPLVQFGDDISTAHSLHQEQAPGHGGVFAPDAPGDGSNFIMNGYGVSWFINDTSGIAGRTLIATVRFYENTEPVGDFIGGTGASVGNLLAAYNFSDPNTTPGIRNTIMKVDDIVMPADVWMTVQFAFSDGSTPNARRPGVLIAANTDWPFIPYFGLGGFPPAGREGGAEVGFSSFWFLAPSATQPNGWTATYFGFYNTSGAVTIPGNLLMSVYGRAVPEPATMGLLALSGLALLRRRR